MDDTRRGVLYPGRLPEFHRLLPSPGLAHAVRWFWIPEWSLPDGVESRQELLPFPACNLVVEPLGVDVFGPATRRSERVLSGSGWAVGALLRPAGAVTLVDEPARLRDGSAPIEADDLHRGVVEAMGGHRADTDTDTGPEAEAETEAGAETEAEAEAEAEARRILAVRRFESWLLERAPEPEAGSEAALANELELVLADPAITRVDQLPPRLHVSQRTLQRIALRCFGLSPRAMIQRRRLQEGAERLREDPGLPIAELAGELGYADHAHFSRDFKSLLGVTPSGYRAAAGR